MELTTEVRSWAYVRLLCWAAITGVVVSIVSVAFVGIVNHSQTWLWDTMPTAVFGPDGIPWWFILVVPTVLGFGVAAFRLLPGDGGHQPLLGFGADPPKPIMLFSIMPAAFLTLISGAVLGREGPLNALGGGLAILIAGFAMRGQQTYGNILILCGSFAAISTLFGNPLAAAVLILEAKAFGGGKTEVILMPGLIAAGVGYVVFTGIGGWAGAGALGMGVPQPPPGGVPTWGDLLWALILGLAVALVMIAARRAGYWVERRASRVNMFVIIPVSGLAIGGLGLAYGALTGENPTDPIFSGEAGMGALGALGPTTAILTLVALAFFKFVAYSISLGAGWRGGPIFPSMFIGGTMGLVAADILPGLSPLAGFTAGIAAGCAAMMRLPLGGLVLATLAVGSAGIEVLPITIIAVVAAVFVRSFTDNTDPVARLALEQTSSEHGAEPAQTKAVGDNKH